MNEYIIHYIKAGEEFNFFNSFLEVLEHERPRIDQKVRVLTNYKKVNKITIGSKKHKTTYINIGAGFDCETTNAGLDYCFSFPYIFQLSLANHIYLVRDVERCNEVFEMLSEAMTEVYDTCKLIVWNANLSFEFAHFKRLWKNSITGGFAKDRRHVLNIELNNNIIIKECLGVFGSSLEKLAEAYTYTKKLKGDLNYDLIRSIYTTMTGIELKYCINDVAILSELTEVAFELYLRKGKKIPLTQTGIVRAKVLEKLGKDKKYKELEVKKYICNRELYFEWRKFLYAGGLTHSLNQNSDGDIVKGVKIYDVVCFDLKSAYPWAYTTQYFPSGEIIDISSLPADQMKEKLNHYKHFVVDLLLTDVETKTQHSLLSKDKVRSVEGLDTGVVIDNGRVYSAKVLYVTMNEVDWKSFKMNYKYSNINIIKAYIFTKTKKCDSFINDSILEFYQTKELKGKEKKTLNKELEALSKKETRTEEEEKRMNELSIMLPELERIYMSSKQDVNGIYGMTATQVYEMTMEYNVNKGEFVEGDLKDWDKINTPFNPLLAYWCTSYVRNRLYEVICTFPDSVYQYDTDSVYVSIKTEGIKEFIDSINERIYNQACEMIPEQFKECRNLGQWENDGNYKYLIPLGCKRYLGCHYDDETEKEFNKINTPAVHKKVHEKYDSKYELSEDDIITFIRFKAQYKLTFAGADKEDVFMNCIKTGAVLEDYIKTFCINEEVSSKLTAVYYDETRTETMTDYEGNTFTVTWFSGAELSNKQFKATLITDLISESMFKNKVVI